MSRVLSPLAAAGRWQPSACLPHRPPLPGHVTQVSRLRRCEAQVLAAALQGEASRDAFEAGGPRVLLLLLDCVSGRQGAVLRCSVYRILTHHCSVSNVTNNGAAGRKAPPAPTHLTEF